MGDRRAGGNEQHGRGEAEDVERFTQRCARVGRAPGLVGAQVARQAVRRRASAPGERGAAAGGRVVREWVHPGAARRLVPEAALERYADRATAGHVPRREMKGVLDEASHRERRLGLPGPVEQLRERFWRCVLAPEVCQAGLVHHPVVDALEPVVEEAHEFPEPIHGRARVGGIGELVDPVPDDRAPRCVHAPLLHPQDGVDVAVHPAPDVEDGRRDPPVVGRERAAPPVRPVPLLARPLEEPDRRRVQPFPPGGLPARARVPRPRRQRVHRHLAHRVLRQLADRRAATDVVDVVRVAVVGGVHRHDRAQVGRAERRDLDGGEAAVRDPPHPDVAIAPRLRGEPFHGVVAVNGFGLGVFVEGHASRAARSPDVEAAKGEAALGQIGAAGDVRGVPPVVLPVRDHLEDGGEPLLGRTGARDREEEVGRQLDPVAGADPDVVADLHLMHGRARRRRGRRHVRQFSHPGPGQGSRASRNRQHGPYGRHSGRGQPPAVSTISPRRER